MKILHTADWHIGKKLDNYSRLEEQRLVLAEICEIAEAEQVDAVVVAGDLFDNFNPSSEATELLYSTLHRLSANGSRAVIAIAGNHDSPERIQVPDALAKVCGIIFVGFPNTEISQFCTQAKVDILRTAKGFVEIELPNASFPLRILHTPYANEQRLKTFLGVEDSEEALRVHLQQHWQELADKYLDDAGFNLLITHLFVMKKGEPVPEEPEEERPILHIGGAQAIYTENFPDKIHYIALGHLHRYQVIDKTPAPAIYSSSPLAYSFSEANQTKYVVLIEAEAGKLVSYRAIELTKGKKLRRRSFNDIDKAIEWLGEHSEDLIELTIVSNNYLEATDKKRLNEAHPGIIQIIPQIKKSELATTTSEIDLSLSMEKLFQEYFKTKNKGQEPSDGLMAVFREVLGTEEEN
ncbi:MULTISPECIES: exonuclease subunit SbcD [Dyadobacter]|uniref:Nuclease SbcCD subunit D n=1 Tax=Dyadobacter chenhuakuii TaxID=2909339 RepID=A0ABY4XIS6_9BACT|nr:MULTISPECIES: exonuclease subunit SbcD [Dyadobacter]MCF2496031.1 exonuclease subunit SbcD [Dyadobacter chenhuakuii]MCF2519982.1 exonuclease subunit SbcD [Dyadobacter sp. CY351]USJ30098.1 exonuclease subunit SbcD [Dyadobacter chenhuakuii]